MEGRRRVSDDAPVLSPHWAQLVDILDRAAVSLVLDIGANVGQYATYLRQSGYSGRIVSFEPQAEAWAALDAAAAGDPAWQVAPPMAIGDNDGTVTVNRSAESDMSSILPLDPAFLESSPSSAYVGQETVPVRRLDAVFGDHVEADDRVFVKIDTQGYERQVLAGAAGVIDAVAGFQVEMSLVPLYDGEATFDELMAHLGALGFAPHLIIPGYYSRHLGRMLQVDGVFLR
jgi:FkbM family methyltransferase